MVFDRDFVFESEFDKFCGASSTHISVRVQYLAG